MHQNFNLLFKYFNNAQLSCTLCLSKTVIPPLQKRAAFSYPAPRLLKEVAKLPLLERHDTATIKSIWNSHFSDKIGIIADVWEEEIYNSFIANIRYCPLFITPTWTSSGFYNYFMEFQHPNVILFTLLESYKTRSTEATPSFVLTLYNELLTRRGVALVRGDITSTHLQRREAEMLLTYALRFYTESHLFEWTKLFNHKPSEFQFEEFKHTAGHCFPHTSNYS